MAIGLAAPAAAQDGSALYTQHCAQCHDGAARAPSRQILAALSVDRILASLTTGLMRAAGDTLGADERTAVARFLSTAGVPATASTAPRCDAPPKAGTSDEFPANLRSETTYIW